jgi:hypothetical protein
MRCLLDKVAARYALEGILKLAQGQDPSREELFTLDLLARASPQTLTLFISPATANILQSLMQLPRYSNIIQLFLDRVNVALPTRYHKRWARRLREVGFTREDAALLALATFSTNKDSSILGMRFVATFDQPMINHWSVQQPVIQGRLDRMRNDLHPPYSLAILPHVLLPQHIRMSE